MITNELAMRTISKLEDEIKNLIDEIKPNGIYYATPRDKYLAGLYRDTLMLLKSVYDKKEFNE